MKKLFRLFICIMLGMCLMGCNMGKKVRYNIKFYEESTENALYHINKDYIDTGKTSYNAEIVKSYDQLLALCDKYNSPAFDEKSEKYSNEVNQLIRSFTREYFESKTLVFYFGNSAKKPFYADIKSMVIKDNTLIINYKKPKGDTWTTEIRSQPWTLIIELNQDVVSNVNNVKAVIK